MNVYILIDRQGDSKKVVWHKMHGVLFREIHTDEYEADVEKFYM